MKPNTNSITFTITLPPSTQLNYQQNLKKTQYHLLLLINPTYVTLISVPNSIGIPKIIAIQEDTLIITS